MAEYALAALAGHALRKFVGVQTETGSSCLSVKYRKRKKNILCSYGNVVIEDEREPGQTHC